jgi:hypothetical protein
MQFMQFVSLFLVLLIATANYAADTISTTIEQLQHKKDSMLVAITQIDKQIAEYKQKQLIQDTCIPYLVNIPSGSYGNIRIRPIERSPFVYGFSKKDSFQVISVIEIEDYTFYGISDGSHTGYITSDMVISGLNFDKEKCLILSYKNALRKKYTQGFFISLIYASEPNSAGGVNVNIGFNPFNVIKEIKYARFQVTPFNQVGDSVYCTISKKSSTILSLTGPISSKDIEILINWENCWYNKTITCIALRKISLEYMDGTKAIYANNINQILDENVLNNCTYLSK